jgi:hypothetical protein
MCVSVHELTLPHATARSENLQGLLLIRDVLWQFHCIATRISKFDRTAAQRGALPPGGNTIFCFLKYVQVLHTLTLKCFYLRVTPFIEIHATQLGLHISRKNTGLSCTFREDTCNSIWVETFDLLLLLFASDVHLHISSRNMQPITVSLLHFSSLFFCYYICVTPFIEICATQPRVARFSKKYGGWGAPLVKICATQPRVACFSKKYETKRGGGGGWFGIVLYVVARFSNKRATQ